MRSHKGRNGSTLVEFAFVLIPLFAMIFGGIEMDRLALTHTALDNAARAGVRYAVVHGCYGGPATTTNVGNVVQTFARMGIIDSSQMSPSLSCTAIASGSSAIHICYANSDQIIGSAVSVSVAYVYAPLTSFFPLSVTLRSTAQGTIAY